MAGSKGNKSVSSKAYYASYDPTAQRRKRLNRHLKDHPNDSQAVDARANPKARGPRKGNKLGWINRSDQSFRDVRGRHQAMTTAWANAISRKAAKQEEHYNNYTPKADRQKGGKAKAKATA